jgi:2-methylcitrate dehydratase
MMSSISRQLAEFAVGLKYQDLPDQVIHEVKRFLIDSIGCAFGGYKSKDPQIVHQVVERLGGAKDCTVIGSGLKTNMVQSALLNALMIRALDYNDIYWKADPSHPSDIIPAALSPAEKMGKSGKDLIVAIVIAYDLEMRLCEIGKPGVREKGWHHATLTGFVSPLVAGKILGLNVDQMVNAVGISACHTFTLGSVTAGKLTMMKNTVDPMATESGVMAALLAKKGYIGPEPIYEGREGLMHCLGKDWDMEPLTRDLGKKFKIPECSMKPYPTEFLTHSPISALLDLKREHGIEADAVKEIRVHTIGRGVEILCDKDKYDPHEKETADHSLPYCLAVALVDGQVVPSSFKMSRIRDSKVLENCQKVKGVIDEDCEKRFPAMQPCKVILVLQDGTELTKAVDYAKGDPRNPLSDEELLVKYKSLSILPEKQDEKLLDALWNLEKVKDVGDLMKRMVVKKGKSKSSKKKK